MRSFPPRPSSAAVFRNALRHYLVANRIDDKTLGRIVLCADEAFINAVEHAGSGSVRVAAAVRNGDLTVDVTDDGGGFDPDCVRRERMPDVLAEHGRGLFLIRQLMDDVEVVSGERGTTLRMRLALCHRAGDHGRRIAGVVS